MAAFTSAVAARLTSTLLSVSSQDPLPVHEALSGIAGSISLVAWIVLLLPQLIENYKNGTAEGLSIAFLTIWLLGDAANLIGAIWAGLLPTVISLAVYFCLADFVLISQTVYYNHITRHLAARREARTQAGGSNDPTEPLLPNRRGSVPVISQHRRSDARRRDSLSAVLEAKPTARAVVTRNIIAILGVFLAGALGWAIAWKTGAWSAPNGNGNGGSGRIPLGAEVLGYLSAVLYLGARIPQIIRNYRKKSCEGLSLLFFILSILGNLTYGAGILFHSTEPDYLRNNLPWLIGSLGTMSQDIIIFAQFHIYSKGDAVGRNSAVC
ncbi:hypothetical protein RUND412_003139 [Rhizina undulata]